MSLSPVEAFKKMATKEHWQQCAKECDAFGKRVMSFDRSQDFSELEGVAKLRARDEMRTRNVIGLIIAIVVVIFAVIGMANGGYLGGCFFLGLALFSGFLYVKEFILQTIARNQEKQALGITPETKEMQYTFEDLAADMTDAIFAKERDESRIDMREQTAPVADNHYVPPEVQNS